MTMSKTSVQAVDLDNLERQMRDIAIFKRSDDRRAELARIVGQNLGGLPTGRYASVLPFQSSIRDDMDEPQAEDGPAQDSEGSIGHALDGDSVGSVPDTPDAALSRRPSRRRSHLSSRALALVVPLLLVTVGVGAAMMMRAGPMAGLGTRAPIIRADGASSQQVAHPAGAQPLSQSTLGTVGSPTNPDQVVAAAKPVPPRDAVNPAATTMPVVAADVSLPNPPQPWAENTAFDTPHRLATGAVKPDAAIMSKGKPEAAPLPPTKPRTLASAGATAFRAAPTIGNVTPAASKAAETTPAKQSDVSAHGAGPSSFSIQLASSLSESEARATLSRLKKLFPDALGGGSVHRAEGNGNGAFYRVQAGPLSRNAAESACSRLKASGENCIVVRS
jgi:hypothetical protein